jgi:hypothetical protein
MFNGVIREAALVARSGAGTGLEVVAGDKAGAAASAGAGTEFDFAFSTEAGGAVEVAGFELLF